MASEDRYRLAPVRDLRARDEKTRKGELASAVGDARETQAKLDAARARTEAARSAVAAAVTSRDVLLTSGATSAELAHADQFIARRRRELERATADELRCGATYTAHQGVVDAARLVLARSRADRQVIERHFERWREQRRKLADRRED